MKTILIVDAGGRGAALVDKYAQSPEVGKILAVPGNDLMGVNTQKPVTIYPHLKTTSVSEIVEICKKEQVDLVDVAQDNAIAAGASDALIENGFKVFGASKEAGQIEWDKAWSRDFMAKHNLPIPRYQICGSELEGTAFLNSQEEDQSWFIKAAGLAEGKGVIFAQNNEEASEKISEMKKFNSAGKTFLLEQALVGEEFSAYAISDGENFQILGYAQDHKRAFDGDLGPNTGGMGCSTPPLVVDESVKNQTLSIFQTTFKGLRAEKRLYVGILYLGGMVVEERGEKKVYIIEFNARWGDPEVECILPGIKNDLFGLSLAAIEGKLKMVKIETDGKARVVVAGASKGYPEDYSAVKGKKISGIEEVLKLLEIKFYSAGIKKEGSKYLANSGRLFYIVGEGKDVIEARKKAYSAMKLISVEGGNLHYRTDIGYRDVERLSGSK